MSTPGAWPESLPVVSVRIAHPTQSIERAIRFYSGVLGLAVVDSFTGHAGYDGVMFGLPGSAHHLELTARVDAPPPPRPAADDHLVLYLAEADHQAVVTRVSASETAIELENPYWAQMGAIAFADPDGRPVILFPLSPGHRALALP